MIIYSKLSNSLMTQIQDSVGHFDLSLLVPLRVSEWRLSIYASCILIEYEHISEHQYNLSFSNSETEWFNALN